MTHGAGCAGPIGHRRPIARLAIARWPNHAAMPGRGLDLRFRRLGPHAPSRDTAPSVRRPFSRACGAPFTELHPASAAACRPDTAASRPFLPVRDLAGCQGEQIGTSANLAENAVFRSRQSEKFDGKSTASCLGFGSKFLQIRRTDRFGTPVPRAIARRAMRKPA